MKRIHSLSFILSVLVALVCSVLTASAQTVSTLAGSTYGYLDATGTAALFRSPFCVAVDPAGNVYVGDYANHKIRKISPAGVVRTLADLGSNGYPRGVAVDGAGNVFAADTENQRVLKFDKAGALSAAYTGFYYPQGVATDAAGNVYVTNTFANNIKKISTSGAISIFAGSGSRGSADGVGTVASFNYPVGIAVDAAGNVYIGDRDNNKIRKITAAGVVSTLAGSGSIGSTNATGAAASFNQPWGVAVDAAGNVYVADSKNNKIRKVTASGVVSTLAGSGTAGSANGTGAGVSFGGPMGVAIDTSGNFYIADMDNQLIRKIAGVALATQSIAFPAIGNRTYGDAPFALGATASSGLPVSYAVASGPATLSGSILSLTGAGTVVIRASQAGNGTYAAAPDADVSFTVSVVLATQSVAFPSIGTKTYGDAPFALGATASSGLPVGYAVVSGPATLSGSILTLTGAGTVVIRASQAGNGTYAAAPDADVSFTVVSNPTEVLGGANTMQKIDMTIPGAGQTFQWYYKGKVVKGATGEDLNIKVTPATAGAYTLKIKDASGITTEKVVVVKAVVKPAFIKQPGAKVSLALGGSTQLAVSAKGESLSYQWYKDGGALSGETGATLTLSNATAGMQGKYTVTVSNLAGSVTSKGTAVTVLAPPTIQGISSAVTMEEGKPFSLSVTATGPGPLSYQWYKDDSPLKGATKSGYTVKKATSADEGDYTVVVKNKVGSTQSSSVSVSSPVILLNPSDLHNSSNSSSSSSTSSNSTSNSSSSSSGNTAKAGSYEAGAKPNLIDFNGLRSSGGGDTLSKLYITWADQSYNAYLSSLSIADRDAGEGLYVVNARLAQAEVDYGAMMDHVDQLLHQLGRDRIYGNTASEYQTNYFRAEANLSRAYDEYNRSLSSSVSASSSSSTNAGTLPNLVDKNGLRGGAASDIQFQSFIQGADMYYQSYLAALAQKNASAAAKYYSNHSSYVDIALQFNKTSGTGTSLGPTKNNPKPTTSVIPTAGSSGGYINYSNQGAVKPSSNYSGDYGYSSTSR